MGRDDEDLIGGWAEKFPGGVPPGEYFRMETDDMIELVSKRDKPKRRNRVAPQI